ncbi:DNA/RNA helicase domain-containing protein [Microbacterium sediminicola]|uniref:DNA/RNA helicase domain-containing protein n=1 Tax=Microbacterium sediminicola TaxID=415210 RepID=UPI0031E44EB4
MIDDSFNTSVCLDLESHLIRWIDGDGRFSLLNSNGGIVDADYYDRERYRESFREIFEELRREGIFSRSIPEIENSDLFKLSPYKALTEDQAVAVDQIVEDLLNDRLDARPMEHPLRVVEGHPGTGKTVVAIYIMKLLADIRASTDLSDVNPDTMFADLFTAENRDALAGLRMGLVVPQQSLRLSIKRVFARTRGLSADMVLTPFEVATTPEPFDLLLVDEAHRLSQRANQSSGPMNKKFIDINVTLFGEDDYSKTHLNWILARSRNQILFLDADQTVRPADLPPEVTKQLVADSRRHHRHYPLHSQMRVIGGQDYITFARRLTRGEIGLDDNFSFPEYDLRVFDDVGAMRDAIFARDDEEGLARLVAGYAWEWASRKDASTHDIELDGVKMTWNRTIKDWISSPGSLSEVGSIHTVQGYDLNYAGVIIGPDLRFDPETRSVYVDRDAYKDARGKENNKMLKRVYSDEEITTYISNIYAVLLTRGIRGTYVYVCDPELREYVRHVFARTVALVEH